MKTINWLLVYSAGLGGDWVRGTVVAELYERLLKEAGVNALKHTHIIYQGILKEETTKEEQEKLFTFWNPGGFGGLYQADNLTAEDRELIENRFLGWVTVELPVSKGKIVTLETLKKQKDKKK